MNRPLSIVFAGTPDFAVPCLQALLDSEHRVCAVYTQPDRRSGRGLKQQFSPVKTLAVEHNIPVFQPETLRDGAEQNMFQALNADLMVVVAYGLLLPEAVLSAPKYGCINVHASLLPRWRGAAPIQHAILAGDKTTGITIMQMEAGLDTGPMLNQISCSINPTDTAVEVQSGLTKLGAEALLMALTDIQLGRQKPRIQDNSKACYAHKLNKQQAQMNWHKSAVELERQIRAFNPWPVAWTTLQGQVVRLWKGQVTSVNQCDIPPGQIVAANKQGIDVATGKGILRLLDMQLAGGKVLSAAQLLNAKQALFAEGMHFKHVIN